MIALRYYQIDIINKILNSIKIGRTRPLVVLTTAGGKTVIMAGLLDQLTCFNGPLTSMIAVPFTGLRKQITKYMVSQGLKTEVLTYSGILHKDYQTRDIILCDEAHHIMSPTWRQIPDIITSEVFVGFTGTPYRSDLEKLLVQNGGFFDELIMGPTMDELTDQGYLANLEYYSYPIKKIVTKQPFYFMKEYMGAIEKYSYKPDNKENEIVEEYNKNFKGMPAIVFARNVGHAKDIADKFNAAGIPARDINCYQPSKVKEEIINLIQHQNIKIVVGCNMMSEGLDIPHLKLVIMARPIVDSLTMFLQQIGRVIRPYQGETARVLDLVGNYAKFGTPQQAAQRRIV